MTSRRPQPTRDRTSRGSLPPSVYWRRRVFVIGLACALVFVTAQWLTAGSDASSEEDPAAEQAGAQVAATDTEESPATDGAVVGGTAPTAPSTARAVPDGPCDPTDIVVTPSIAPTSVAGRDVVVQLSLQTVTSAACTWQVSKSAVTVKIAQGTDEVWSTRQCPKVVARQDVIVRSAVARVVSLTWDARESNEGCTKRRAWVRPGTFTIAAAALGGEPAVAEFKLGAPAPETIQVTPKSKPKKKATKLPKTPVN